jgi:hypothetical protein
VPAEPSPTSIDPSAPTSASPSLKQANDLLNGLPSSVSPPSDPLGGLVPPNTQPTVGWDNPYDREIIKMQRLEDAFDKNINPMGPTQPGLSPNAQSVPVGPAAGTPGVNPKSWPDTAD